MNISQQQQATPTNRHISRNNPLSEKTPEKLHVWLLLWWISSVGGEGGLGDKLWRARCKIFFFGARWHWTVWLCCSSSPVHFVVEGIRFTGRWNGQSAADWEATDHLVSNEKQELHLSFGSVPWELSRARGGRRTHQATRSVYAKHHGHWPSH